MNAIAPIGATRHDFSEKYYIPIAFLHRDPIIADADPERFQLRHLVIVGGKQRSCAEMPLIMNVFGDRPGDAQSVVRARSASDFIQEDQTVLAGTVENLRTFGHFDHKRALSGRKVIGGAHSCENSVYESEVGLCSRNEAAVLSEQPDKADLP